ncbi:MAG: decaprenyl-phosphate phosphoribosyltransferase [Chloroflexi bacterium]|nr:decaprenyl-phosphate phosphoribosyltransferase [Chloroflexota bacterium]
MSTSAKTGQLAAFILSMRPKQWSKNLLVFMALFFTVDQAWDPTDLSAALDLFIRSAAAFLLFSALSGVVYLVNDLMDREEDRRHPKKRHRPIASGRLPIAVASVAAAVIGVPALAASYFLEPLFGLIAIVYIAIMLLYSFGLKRVVLIDVFSISGGFILRAVAGAVVIDSPISPWLYICTGLAAVFVVLSKRRSELAVAGKQAEEQRGILKAYTLPVLDQLISVAAAAALVSYTLYTVASENLPENHAMLLTVPFVVYGLFRYMYLVQRKDVGETPEDVILTDIPLIIAIVLWLSTAGAVLIAFRG